MTSYSIVEKIAEGDRGQIVESQRWESNPQPPHYECGALPIEATLAEASGRKTPYRRGFKVAQRISERQVAVFFKAFSDKQRNKKSGASTRQERPAIVKRVRGKATARPKKVEDPTFLRCG